MKNYLADEHKKKIESLVKEIALDIVTSLTKEGDQEKLDFSALYELQDHLLDYTIGDFGIEYPDSSRVTIHQLLSEVYAREEVKRLTDRENEKDPWMLGS